MATKDPARKFAEQALIVERLLDSHHIKGGAGRVVFVLVAASKFPGITQQQLLLESKLPKDALSKLIRSLEKAGLVGRVRENYNARIKRLTTARPGIELLSQIKAVLQPPSPGPEPPKGYRPRLWDDTVAE